MLKKKPAGLTENNLAFSVQLMPSHALTWASGTALSWCAPGQQLGQLALALAHGLGRVALQARHLAAHRAPQPRLLALRRPQRASNPVQPS